MAVATARGMPMTTELVPRPADAPMPWSAEQVEILRQQICPGASNDELAFFAQVCAHKQLDPFLGEIVGIMRYDSRARKEVMKIQETVEGLRSIAERSGLYGGFRGPQWTGDGHTWVDVWLDEVNPPKAARYWVIRKDWVEPAPGVARWASNVQLYKDKQGQMQVVPLWKDRPDEMLAKCAEVRALKRTFNKEFARAGVSVRDLSDAQIVTMEAREAGLDDEARHALVAQVTGGRTQSTTELTEDETLEARQQIARRAPAGANLSPSCSSGQHGTCPGYYKMAYTCDCSCHRAKPEPEPEPEDAVVRTIARAAGDLEARLERLTPWQIEELKTWRRAYGLARPIGTLDPTERTRLATELDRPPPPPDTPPPPTIDEPDPYDEEPF
jgi:phage recombination protein Bet